MVVAIILFAVPLAPWLFFDLSMVAFWVVASIAGVLSICFYLFYLELQTIAVVCPKCLRPVETNVPWLCGYKKCRNENVRSFPFINECEHCHNIPKAYVCDHCTDVEFIYLTPEKQKAFFARSLMSSELVPVIPEDPIAEKVAKQMEEVRDLEHKFKLTKINTDIKIEEKRTEKPEEESLLDLAVEDLERLTNEQLTDENAILFLEKKYREEFEGEELERRLGALHRAAQYRWEKKNDAKQ